MDWTSLSQPTTTIGLAAVAIVALVYLSGQHDKIIKETQEKFMKSLEEKDTNYQSFVMERNHQTGELIEKSTAVMVEVKENIRSNTDSIRQLIDLHLKK